MQVDHFELFSRLTPSAWEPVRRRVSLSPTRPLAHGSCTSNVAAVASPAEHVNPDTPYMPLPDVADWATSSFSSSNADENLEVYRGQLGDCTPAIIASVQERMLREAAATTGAVEELYELAPGQTRTIAIAEEGWRQPLLLQGGSTILAFEDQLSAYEYVRDMALASEQISEHAIRELHSIACRSQTTLTAYAIDPRTNRLAPHEVRLIAGEYKFSPNHVTRRDGSLLEYCPPLDTPAEMHRFVSFLQSDTFTTLPALLQAAYAHYGLVHIHPFADGNGRVARLLVSYYTFRSYEVPLIVYPDRRMTYFQALEGVRVAETTSLIEYVSDRVAEALARAQQEVDSLSGESLLDEIVQLQSAIATASEISIEAAAEVATRLMEEFAAAVDEKLTEVGNLLEGAVQVGVTRQHTYGGSGDLTNAYPVQQTAHARIELSRPAKLSVYRALYSAVASDLSARFPFRIASRRGNSPYGEFADLVEVRFEDATPSLSEGARPRVRLAAESVVRSMINELNNLLATTLRQSGNVKY